MHQNSGLVLLVVIMMNTGIISAQDWAQLAYYKKENLELEKEELSSDRVVFMGNSITIGWLQHFPEFFKNKSYVNRGISGQTTPQMLIRFKQDVVALKPAVVVILAGTNDIAGNTGPSSLEMILDNISSMAEIARSNNIQVVLASVLPAFDYPWRPGLSPNDKIPALNAMIRDYAKENEFVYLDYFSNMSNEENGMIESYAYDGVHPNREGYGVMAPLTKAAIDTALNLKKQ